MFNKSSVFGRQDTRSDSVTRRDALSTGAGNTTSAKGATERLPQRTSASSDTSGTRAAPALAPVATSRPPVGEPATATSAPEGNAAKEIPVLTDDAAATGARLIVGPEVKLRGAEILDCDTLVVEGRVEPTMDSRVIRITESGSFSGKVSIDIAVIHGSFEGELTARSQLIIHSTGRVSGTIRYGKLVADEGGELSGDVGVISAGLPKARSGDPLQVIDSRPAIGIAAG